MIPKCTCFRTTKAANACHRPN